MVKKPGESITPRLVRKAELNEKATLSLRQCRAVITGKHLNMGGGFCGSEWLNIHELFRRPDVVLHVVQEYGEFLGCCCDLSEITVVAGTERGGSMLAFILAGMLNGAGPMSKSPVSFCQVQEDAQGNFVIPPTYAQGLAGAKVLAIDDVRNTGRTLHRSIEALQALGAEVTMSSVLFDRNHVLEQHQLSVPFEALVDYTDEDPRIWPATECPMCILGKPHYSF